MPAEALAEALAETPAETLAEPPAKAPAPVPVSRKIATNYSMGAEDIGWACDLYGGCQMSCSCGLLG